MFEVFNTSFTTQINQLCVSAQYCKAIKILDEAGETKTRYGKLAIEFGDTRYSGGLILSL